MATKKSKRKLVALPGKPKGERAVEVPAEELSLILLGLRAAEAITRDLSNRLQALGITGKETGGD